MATEVVPDEREIIAFQLKSWADGNVAALILTTGGTGVAPRDITPEATVDVIERQIPGISELMRARGLEQTPLSVLSRAVVGSRGRTLIINLPGSPKGAVHSLRAVDHLVPHILDLLAGRTEHSGKQEGDGRAAKLRNPTGHLISDDPAIRNARVFFWAMLGLKFALVGQIQPGRLPDGPPPQPGQLGPAPTSPAKAAAPTPSTSQPVIGDLGTATGPSTFSTTVRTVLVPTTVLDPDGHGYVNGLAPNEFALYDNDKPQRISAEFTQLPMSVVMVVQANSEIEPFLPKLRKTGVLLHGLVTGEGGDVAIMAFDHRLTVLQDFTQDPDKLDDATPKAHLRLVFGSSD